MSASDSSGIAVRRVAPDELRPVLEAVESASGGEIDDEAWRYAESTVEADRAWGAFDGGQPVGGGALYSYRLTVPGGSVGAAGVTFVGVQPTHRRRGILRRMMTEMLADARQRGEPVAILWASEGSIYGRFGFGLATLNGKINIERDRAVLTALQPAQGKFRMIDADLALELFPPVYERVARITPGFFSRSRAWWKNDVLSDIKAYRRGAGRKFYVVHERDGAPAGYVLYRVETEWADAGSLSTLQVQEVMAVDSDALRDMWRFIFGVDLIHRIRVRVGPPDNPLLLMTLEPRRLDMRVGDGLWLRILDVPAALAARSYAADGNVVIEVGDESLPELAGRWRIAVDGGRATVSPTEEAPDIALDMTDLGAVYLGAFSFAQLDRAGRIRAPAEAIARADALFTTTIRPWCPQIF